MAADLSPTRRALAERLGADEVVDPAVEPAIAAWRRVDGTRPLVIFEAVGVPGMLDACMRMAPKGTRILVVGACMEADTVRPIIGIGKELSLQFVLGYEPHEFAAALMAIAEGKVDLEPMITGVGHRRRRAAGLRRPRPPRRPRQDPGAAMSGEGLVSGRRPDLDARRW